jgi:hypothetical protein
MVAVDIAADYAAHSPEEDTGKLKEAPSESRTVVGE